MNQKYLTNEDVRKILADEIEEAGTASQWAFENGYSKPYVSYVVNGHKPPSRRLLDDLGLKEVKVYARKEKGDV